MRSTFDISLIQYWFKRLANHCNLISIFNYTYSVSTFLWLGCRSSVGNPDSITSRTKLSTALSNHPNQVEVWTLTVSFVLCHSVVDLLLCLGSLSCCMIHFQSSFSCQTDGLTFDSRILCYTEEFVTSGCITSPNHDLPPPCLTVGTRYLCWYDVFVFHQTFIMLVSGHSSEQAILIQSFSNCTVMGFNI